MWAYSWWSGGKMPWYMVQQIKKNLKKTNKKLKKLAAKEMPVKLQDEIKADQLLDELGWFEWDSKEKQDK